jgi:hypothetical protein
MKVVESMVFKISIKTLCCIFLIDEADLGVKFGLIKPWEVQLLYFTNKKRCF